LEAVLAQNLDYVFSLLAWADNILLDNANDELVIISFPNTQHMPRMLLAFDVYGLHSIGLSVSLRRWRYALGHLPFRVALLRDGLLLKFKWRASLWKAVDAASRPIYNADLVSNFTTCKSGVARSTPVSTQAQAIL
jgi:hypothetical protein